MLPQRALGLGATTFFASRERCRLPESLLLVEAMRRLAGLPCSVSLRAGGRFLLSSSESSAGNRTEDDVVEIADYDPVRHTVLAIGVKEPSPDVAVHWLAYRTDETAGAAALVWDFPRRKGVYYVEGKHPWGSFDEALAMLTLAKSSGGPAGIEGRGYLLRAKNVDGLVAALDGLARLNGAKAEAKPRDRRPARRQAAGRRAAARGRAVKGSRKVKR